jgi:hypothetical protein
LNTFAMTTNMNAILKPSHMDLRCKNLCTVTQCMWIVIAYNSIVYGGEGGLG